MTQAYSDPSRESDPHALPDVEVFYMDAKTAAEWTSDLRDQDYQPGWYFWFCFPGCLPDSDPEGPFESEQAALEAAQEASE